MLTFFLMLMVTEIDAVTFTTLVKKKKNVFVIPTEARLGESFLFQLYNITNLFNLHTDNAIIIIITLALTIFTFTLSQF